MKAQDAPALTDSQADPDAQNPDQDPPSRVARLDFKEGSVSFQPGGENDWVDAVLNRPLTTGDNLWADEDSRAEVHIGSTALQLGPKTGITLLEVSDRAAQIRLAQGSLIVDVRHVDDDDTYEIDTPNVAFVVDQPGAYRIDVDADAAQTNVTVWRGRGEVTGGGSTYTVIANQYATFSGTDQISYDLEQIPNRDDLDAWAFQRDQAEDNSDSANYVSREMTGYEDLDEYGDWSYVAEYGPVWRPRVVVAGWAPYRFGHWAWVGPWGWTWVEDEPWGFAPFHYGRWAFVGGNWAWVPGPSVVRPIYAPALVAWVGAPGARFSFGAGVGWFPLGPGEVFIPGYRVSRVYLNRVNVTNTTVNVTRVTNVYNSVFLNRTVNNFNVTYANRTVAGGVTVVSRDTFVNARSVSRNAVQLSAKEVAAAPVARMAAVEPVLTSVVGAGAPVGRRPPTAVTTRTVVAVRTPAPMPGSLEQRQAQAGGHLNQVSSSAGLVRQQAPGKPVAMQNPAARTPQTAQSSTQSSDGFTRFGESNGASQPKATHIWEAQGTPEPQPNVPVGTRNAPPTETRNSAPTSMRGPQEQGQSQQWSHPLAKPAPPVRRDEQQQHDQEQKFSNWHQQQSAGSSSSARSAQHSSSSSSESKSSAKK
ncbi:MAG TPA: DUF6600 domain-containing protein [Candidatus Binatia bacterium]|nr:DUF6600 domain-containing protein [Candidatus Binatia bacterium]